MIINTRNWQGDNLEYMINGLLNVITRVDLHALGVKCVAYAQSLGVRGMWVRKDATVLLNPHSKSFWPEYKGYQYKKFGGRKDLSPGGVFAHECGHALCDATDNAVVNDFIAWRKKSKKSITWYGSKHPAEDVAECFRLYVSNPGLLQEVCAGRYAIIHRHAEQYMRKPAQAYIPMSRVQHDFPHLYSVLHEIAIDSGGYVNPLYMFDVDAMRLMLEQVETTIASYADKTVGDMLTRNQVDKANVYLGDEWDYYAQATVLEAIACSESQVLEALIGHMGAAGKVVDRFFMHCFDGDYSCDAYGNQIFYYGGM